MRTVRVSEPSETQNLDKNWVEFTGVEYRRLESGGGAVAIFGLSDTGGQLVMRTTISKARDLSAFLSNVNAAAN